MRHREIKQIGIALLLALLATEAAALDLRVRPVEWAQPVIGLELGNFFKVSDELYRSEQPDDEKVEALGRAGIRSILNLREYHADPEKVGKDIVLHRVPMNAGEIDDAQIEQALTLIAKAPKPILVHCWYGSDRTGVVVAMYRMVMQDWPREKAIDEFVNGGYGYHERVYPNIEKYLETVDIQRFKQIVTGRKP